MPVLQFQPLASQPTPSFWTALNALKLDKLKLDDAEQPISGWMTEGKEIIDKDHLTGKQGGMISVDGSLGVGGSAFGEGGERWVQDTMQMICAVSWLTCSHSLLDLHRVPYP